MPGPLRTTGRLADRVELHSLESGLVGGREPTLERVQEAEAQIRDVALRLRRAEFAARPKYLACTQCAVRDICPHTAWHAE
jgi:hypothetical protein